MTQRRRERPGGLPAPVIVAVLAAVVTTLVAGTSAAQAPSSEDAPLPGSVAAIGDSITTATNLGLLGADAVNEEHSWATGRAIDGIASQTERVDRLRLRDAWIERTDVAVSRLLSFAAPRRTARHNLARPGAKVADGPRQATAAVALDAEYVTYLLGANDACAPTVAAMTDPGAFEADVLETLDTLANGLPDADVLVLSIPDVTALWEIYGTFVPARQAWARFGICPAALGPDATDADRAAVRRRIEAYNDILAEACAAEQRCRHDGGAVFEAELTRGDVSALDFFHPSILGQRKLADTAWEAGPWADR